MYGVITGSFGLRRLALVLGEHALIVGAVMVAAVVRLGMPDALAPAIRDWLGRAVLVAAILQICLHYADLYDVRTIRERGDLVLRLVRALGAASVILAVLYYWIPSLIVGRGVFAVAAAVAVVLILAWRQTFEWLSLHGNPSERLLIVGTGSGAVALAKELFERRTELGVELVGFIDPDPARVGAPLINPGVIGVNSDIPGIVRARKVDRVVVSLVDARGKLNMDELLSMKLNQGVRFDHLASVYEEYTGKIALENLRPSWLIFSEGFRVSRRLAITKRVVDVLLAFTGLLLALPVMTLVAVALRLSSPGPVLYSQRRVGKDGVEFTIYKFRSMKVDAERDTGAVWAQHGDPRVTRVGQFLRRTRLDELPQLWNVVVGDMSIVGPRPERPEFVAGLTQEIPFYGQRHAVRPGVTGWAQVRHRYAASVGDAYEKLQYDLFYIKHVSLAFDLFILLETAKTVVVRRGS